MRYGVWGMGLRDSENRVESPGEPDAHAARDPLTGHRTEHRPSRQPATQPTLTLSMLL